MRFVFEQTVPAAPEPVFAFFADPANLAVLHRDDDGFRLLHHAGSIAAGHQTWIECRVARVLPVVLGFHHDGLDAPHSFSDQLVHGPFERFAHRHEFDPVVAGTRVRDVLDIRLPWYYGGELAMRWWIAPGVHARFRLRHDALARIFAMSARLAP